MKLFKREPSNSSVPQEIQNYYTNEHRERAGVAWLLAAGVFVGTLLLASALFFGGRWTYRKIAHKDTDKPAAVQVDKGTSADVASGDVKTPDSGTNPQSSTQTNPQASTGRTTPTVSLPNTGPGDE